MSSRGWHWLAGPRMRPVPQWRDPWGSSLRQLVASGWVSIVVLAVALAGCLGSLADGEIGPTGSESGEYDSWVEGDGCNNLPANWSRVAATDPVLGTDRQVSFVGPGLHHVRINAPEDVTLENVSWDRLTAEGSAGPKWFARMKLDASLDGLGGAPCNGPPPGLNIRALNSRVIGHSTHVDPVMEKGIWNVFAYIVEDGQVDFEFNRTSNDEPVILNQPSQEFNATWHLEVIEGTFPSGPGPFDWDYEHRVRASGPGFAIAAMEVWGSPFFGSDGMTVQVADGAGRECNNAAREPMLVDSNNPITVTTTGTLQAPGEYVVDGSFSAALRSNEGAYGAEVASVTVR